MDLSHLALVLTLFLGGLGLAYGGYSLESNHHLLAILSYVVGISFITAAILHLIHVASRQTTDLPASHGTTPLQSSRKWWRDWYYYPILLIVISLSVWANVKNDSLLEKRIVNSLSSRVATTHFDDALKWQFAEKLRATLSAPGIGGSCAVVVTHLPDSYGKKLGDILNEVLDHAGWYRSRGNPDPDFQPGVTIRTPRNENGDNPAFMCAVNFQNMLREFFNIEAPIENVPVGTMMGVTPACEHPCFEVNIGNAPDPTPLS